MQLFVRVMLRTPHNAQSSLLLAPAQAFSLSVLSVKASLRCAHVHGTRARMR